MSLIVGAYAAARPAETDGAARLTEKIRDVSLVGGLEVPYRVGLDVGADWPDAWTVVVTCLPITAECNSADEMFGLASPDEVGRGRAVDLARNVHRDVQRLIAQGVQIVAVEFHSAPAGRACPEAFLRSLREIASWPWDPSVELLVEHCDAASDHGPGEKDFLGLEEELACVASLRNQTRDQRWGMCLNWGRSAIEGRSAQVALAQVERTADAGLLKGVIFSGASDQATIFGDAWVDRHIPPIGTSLAPNGAVLGPEEICDALIAAGPLSFVGAKFGFRPDSLSTAERASALVEALSVVEQAVDDANRTTAISDVHRASRGSGRETL